MHAPECSSSQYQTAASVQGAAPWPPPSHLQFWQYAPDGIGRTITQWAAYNCLFYSTRSSQTIVPCGKNMLAFSQHINQLRTENERHAGLAKHRSSSFGARSRTSLIKHPTCQRVQHTGAGSPPKTNSIDGTPGPRKRLQLADLRNRRIFHLAERRAAPQLCALPLLHRNQARCPAAVQAPSQTPWRERPREWRTASRSHRFSIQSENRTGSLTASSRRSLWGCHRWRDFNLHVRAQLACIKS